MRLMIKEPSSRLGLEKEGARYVQNKGPNDQNGSRILVMIERNDERKKNNKMG